MKRMNYNHSLHLHSLSSHVRDQFKIFKYSLLVHRIDSPCLDSAIKLYEENSISYEEFNVLRLLSDDVQLEKGIIEGEEYKNALEAYGNDIQTLLGLLLDKNLMANINRITYYNIIFRILEISDTSPDLIDFYFPQLFQVYLIQCLDFNNKNSLMKIDGLQQIFLVLSLKYPSFGIRLIWQLLSSLTDYTEKKVLSEIQYCSSLSLLIQLEFILNDGYVSILNDIHTSYTLSQFLKPNSHQQQELAYELSVLFLSRRKLQEQYDESEELMNKRRNKVLLSATEKFELNKKIMMNKNKIENSTEISLSMEKDEESFVEDIDSKIEELENEENEEKSQKFKQYFKNLFPSGYPQRLKTLRRDLLCVKHPSATTALSSIEIFYQLGVGQNRYNNENDSDEDSNNDETDREIEQIKNTEDENDEVNHQEDKNVLDDNNNGDNNKIEKRKKKKKKYQIIPPISTSKLSSPYFYPSHLTISDLKINLWENFSRQLDFVSRLNLLVEHLRFIDRPLRTSVFVKELDLWNEGKVSPEYSFSNTLSKKNKLIRDNTAPSTSNSSATTPVPVVSSSSNSSSENTIEESFLYNPILGWDPLTGSGEPLYKIIRIITKECRVFRTKARAPSLLFYEVMRDDIYQNLINSSSSSPSSSPSSSLSSSPSISSTPSFNYGNGDLIERETRQVMSTLLERSEENNESSTHHYKLKFSSTQDVNPSLREIDNLTHTLDSKSMNDLALNEENVIEGYNYEEDIVSQTADGNDHDSNNVNFSERSLPIPPSSPSSTSSSSPVTPSSPLTNILLPKRRSSSILSSNRLSASVDTIIKNNSGNNSVNLTNNLTPSTASTNSLDNLENNLPQDSSSSTSHKKTSTEKKVFLTAQRLLAEKKIDQQEYIQLLLSDLNFHEEQEKERTREELEKQREQEKKLETQPFGVLFEEKKKKYLGIKDGVNENNVIENKYYEKIDENDENYKLKLEIKKKREEIVWPIRDLRMTIVKTNDDLRQEICCMQVMNIFKEIFSFYQLDSILYLRPYRIISTGSNTGLLEVIPNTISLDGLKHSEIYSGSLSKYFFVKYGGGEPGGESSRKYQEAKKNFIKSLAAYSLFTYLLLIKDRHNGNILIDSEGHLLHIDFGFMLGIAPGGSFSLETAPFKMTSEILEFLGGEKSLEFGEFVTAFTKGYLALQANRENILDAITILSMQSAFPCFYNRNTQVILEKLKQRFKSELNVQDINEHCKNLISSSLSSYGTGQYDSFQQLTNGILP